MTAEQVFQLHPFFDTVVADLSSSFTGSLEEELEAQVVLA